MPRPPSAPAILLPGLVLGALLLAAAGAIAWLLELVPQATTTRLIAVGVALLLGVITSLVLQLAMHRRAVAAFEAPQLDQQLRGPPDDIGRGP
jgi:uncharacterized membrane protein